MIKHQKLRSEYTCKRGESIGKLKTYPSGEGLSKEMWEKGRRKLGDYLGDCIPNRRRRGWAGAGLCK